MKKTIVFVLLGVLYGATVYADEMLVTLESGNTLVVQYTGTIHGVSLQGTSDTITAMQRQKTGTYSNQSQSPPVAPQTAPQVGDVNPDKNEPQKSTVKIGWADPKMED